jgi:hypothetical protein
MELQTLTLYFVLNFSFLLMRNLENTYTTTEEASEDCEDES